jgi:Nitrogen permease regulator 2
MHIDGILNAKQISQKAEVDMELVRACLRVLKHHSVIALVDMFYFTNRYECTKNAAVLQLSTSISNSKTSTVLLEEAVRYSFRGNDANLQSNEGSYNNVEGSQLQNQQQQPQYNSPLINPSTSPIRSLTILHNAGIANHHRPMYGSPLTPPTFMYERSRSSNENGTVIGGRSSGNNNISHVQQQNPGSFRTNNSEILDYAKQRKDYNEIKRAIAELYCSCHRGTSIGDILLDRIKNTTGSGKKGRTTGEENHIDWAKIYPLIDFRRFTSFGILYGLLKRVHCYPVYVSDGIDVDTTEEADVTTSPDVTFMSTSSIGAIGGSKMNQLLNRANSLGPNNNNKTIGSSTPSSSTMSVSRLFSVRAAHYRNAARGISLGSNVGGGMGFTSNNSMFQQLEAKEERQALIARIRERMDGTHCDDELVCAFQLPLLELFDIVCDTTTRGSNKKSRNQAMINRHDDNNRAKASNKKTANILGKRIISVYATER